MSGIPPLQQPKTNEEVKWRQMDIIYFLAMNGVPITEKDSTGQSPSDKASMLDEIDFTEGAMLLGMNLHVSALHLIRNEDRYALGHLSACNIENLGMGLGQG